MVIEFINRGLRSSLSCSREDRENELDDEVAVTPDKLELQLPSQYKVVLLNDDFTTMDFVVEVLEKFFSMSAEKAAQTMMVIHKEGKAVCGIYSRDIAETKAELVNQFSREHGHPLLCKIEKMD